MPRAAPHACSHPGCRTLTTERHCEAHRKQHHREINARRRGSSTALGYGRQWQKTRLAVLTDEPLCRFCNEQGKTVAATEVDHIDGNSFNNEGENLRPLCKSCHSRRTARDQAFGRKPQGG